MSPHTILIVEDDPHLRTIIRLVLEGDGYDVATCADGVQAFSTYLRQQSDLVITDVFMPGMGGMELVQKIRAHNPRVKVIYMTGHHASLSCRAMREEESRYQVMTLEKPFARMQLRNAVARSFDDRD